MRSYQQFFAEMTRRKVFKVAAVYGAAGFGLLQLADLIKDGFGLPDTFIPFITAIVLLGFPLAVILAWALEVTPDGVRKTEVAGAGELAEIVALPASKRWPAGILALAGFAALVGGVWLAGQRSGASTALADSPAAAGSPEVRLAMTDLSEDPRPSIAVLPFADMSPDGDQAYYSDGMTEEILNVLARIKDLRVAARTSTFALKDQDLTASQWGDTLRVAYLIEGSVRKAGEQVRITAQLIDTTDGSHLWTDAYTRPLTDIFEVQAEIAEAIADALKVPLGLDAASDLVTPTADLEAYDLYLAGRGYIRGRGQGLNEAIRLFEAAIARDSSWAPAWAGLAEAKELLTWYPGAWVGGRPSDEAVKQATQLKLQAAAEDAARRALGLDASAVSAHVALGSVHRYRNEWRESEAEYLRALEIDPDNPEAFQQYGEMLEDVGRISESARSARRALDLDAAPVRYLQLGSTLGADGRWDDALEQLRLGRELDTDGALAQLRDSQFWAYLEAGRYDAMFDYAPPEYVEARASIEEALRTGDVSVMPSDLVETTFWMLTGHPDSAAAALLEDFTENPGQWPGWIWTETFDPLRNQPAYLEALKLLNLEGRTPQRTPR